VLGLLWKTGRDSSDHQRREREAGGQGGNARVATVGWEVGATPILVRENEMRREEASGVTEGERENHGARE
jgi:hypothetical protein